MKYRQPRRTVRTGPEKKGQDKLIAFLQSKGWHVEKLHGGMYQQGFPDLYAIHPIHEDRWIEMKAPGGKLRKSQKIKFPIWTRYGKQVYVLEGPEHYARLFKPRGNWLNYL